MKRAETGSVIFGNDCPGVFIRGDRSAYFAMCLDAVLSGDDSIEHLKGLKELQDLLDGCIAAQDEDCIVLKDLETCLVP